MTVQIKERREAGLWHDRHDPVVFNPNLLEQEASQGVALLVVCGSPRGRQVPQKCCCPLQCCLDLPVRSQSFDLPLESLPPLQVLGSGEVTQLEQRPGIGELRLKAPPLLVGVRDGGLGTGLGSRQLLPVVDRNRERGQVV
ncbi:MAG: hypothetical protein M3R02_08355 [Chloroflexota bacterium]|nr:hypothetical protein [Chloroflexota bacterium]